MRLHLLIFCAAILAATPAYADTIRSGYSASYTFNSGTDGIQERMTFVEMPDSTNFEVRVSYTGGDLTPDPAGGHDVLVAGNERFVTLDIPTPANPSAIEWLNHAGIADLRAVSLWYSVTAVSNGVTCSGGRAHADITLIRELHADSHLISIPDPIARAVWSADVALNYPHGC